MPTQEWTMYLLAAWAGASTAVLMAVSIVVFVLRKELFELPKKPIQRNFFWGIILPQIFPGMRTGR